MVTTVHGSKDCGNSPKNIFVQKIAVALETGEPEPDDFSQTVVWDRSFAKTVNGRPALIETLATQPRPVTITVEHAISHGKVGAANGEVVFENGDRHRFSHIVEFTSAKASCVGRIKSYR